MTGQTKKLMHILERALKIRQTVLGNDHEYTAKTSMHLGHVYAALGADKSSTLSGGRFVHIVIENGCEQS